MFNLSRYFSTLSFVMIMLAAGLLGYFYNRLSVAQLLSMAQDRNVAMAQVFRNTLWPRHGEFLRTVDAADAGALRARPEIVRLHAEVSAQMHGTDIIKAKVYNRAGLTVYSSDAKQIGENKHSNGGFREALAGRVASELIHRNTFDAFEGTLSDLDVICSYVPIRNAGDEIEGVFELYQNVTPFLVYMHRTIWWIAGGLLGVFGLLYLSQFLVVRRAHVILHRQGGELEAANRELDSRVRERTSDLETANRLLEAEVAERRAVEVALNVEVERYRAVTVSANDAIISIDAAGGIVGWNPAAERLFGYTEAEAAGQSVVMIVPQRFHRSHYDGMEKRLAGDAALVSGKTIEADGRRKDGSEFPLELSVSEWNTRQEKFFTGIIRDITERKRIERQLEDHKDHLEEIVHKRTAELSAALAAAKLADQTKDAFLANMSHELRTPLTAVIGMANLAQGISAEPALRDYLGKIVNSGKHLNRIIDELLDLSKISAGRMELETISFSLRDAIEHLESVMGSRAAEKGLEIVKVIDAAVPDVLLGDPTRLLQILLNLLGNAIKFTPAGRIAIRVSLRGREESRVCLDIEVEDSGIGIRSVDLEQLFKPFTQVDATVSRKYGGTGLGLTISRRLAEMMGGDISVTSIEGRGTTFKVRIWLGLGNAADLPSGGQLAGETLPQSYHDVRILVAEDQPLNREIVEALLTAVGITPRMAVNGLEALDILTGCGADFFDLVLMDIQMPVMDGLTATRTMRSRPELASIPIIGMTAHTMAHEQKASAEAGMSDHIGKPFNNASFYATLARWIPRDKQRLATPAVAAKEMPKPSLRAKTALHGLTGVDVEAALSRFGGKEDRYRHWLADFATTASAIPDKIRRDVIAGNHDAAAGSAHAFKGQVGMMGMTGLFRAVSDLEPALRNGLPADEMLAGLEQSIGQMRDQVTRTLTCGGQAPEQQE